MTEKKLKQAERDLARERALRRKAELEKEREQAKTRKALQKQEREEATGRLLRALAQAIGKRRALGMGRAFEIAFPDRTWKNLINDTTPVRTLIRRLRRGDKKKGVPPMPICSTCCNIHPGYYIPVGQEFEEWLKKKEKLHLDGLGEVALFRRVTLPDLLGQKALTLRAAEGEG